MCVCCSCMMIMMVVVVFLAIFMDVLTNFIANSAVLIIYSIVLAKQYMPLFTALRIKFHHVFKKDMIGLV